MITLLSLIFDILAEGFKGGLSIINGILSEIFKTDHRLKADFSNRSNLGLSKQNTGFNVHGLSLDHKNSRQGLLVSGSTGKGKGIGQFIRSVLTVEGSQWVYAPSFEVFNATSGYRSETDRILVFAPEHPKRSMAFNPMFRAKTLSQISRLSFLIISTFASQKDKKSFWNRKSQELLTVIIWVVKQLKNPKYHNLTNCAWVLDHLASVTSRPFVDALVMDLADDFIYQKYQSIISQSDEVLQGVVSSCQASLQFFSINEDIARLTSYDTLGDFAEFRKQRTTCYLVGSVPKAEFFGPIMSILLDQYNEELFSKLHDEASDFPIFYHLDEAPTLSLDVLDMNLLCANARKNGGNVCLLTQDAYAQFAKFGNHVRDSILANLNTKVFYSINSVEHARLLSEQMGQFEYTDDYDDGKVKKRRLKTVSEIMQIPEGHALITQSGKAPLIEKYTPYFQDTKCRTYSKIPPYELETEHPLLQLVDLKSMYPNADLL